MLFVDSDTCTLLHHLFRRSILDAFPNKSVDFERLIPNKSVVFERLIPKKSVDFVAKLFIISNFATCAKNEDDEEKCL